MKNLFQSELFWEISFGIIYWLISFSIISWLVEGSFWLHFFLSSSSSYALYGSTKREIKEKFVPIFQNIDDNINTLYSKSTSLEEELDELKDKIKELEYRLDDVEDRTAPVKHNDSF